MRKRFKIKRSACGLCKPFKQGWQHRHKEPELARLKEFEKLKLSLEHQH